MLSYLLTTQQKHTSKMAIITTNSAHELDTQLSRIELANAAYYLGVFANKTCSKMPQLAEIAAQLASEILDKQAQMQALIYAEIAAENQD